MPDFPSMHTQARMSILSGIPIYLKDGVQDLLIMSAKLCSSIHSILACLFIMNECNYAPNNVGSSNKRSQLIPERIALAGVGLCSAQHCCCIPFIVIHSFIVILKHIMFVF